MKKLITILLTLLFVFALTSCENVVLDEMKTYDVTKQINSLEVEIKAADFRIEQATEFSVESNLKYLSVKQENGVLKIVDEAKGSSNFNNARLTIQIPTDKVFESVSIKTGAGKLTVDTLTTGTMTLRLGAGETRFNKLIATQSASIEGGAGKTTIASGAIINLTLEMGAGEFNLVSLLAGNNRLKFGIGESNVTLYGTRADYKVDVEKGVGSITVDGQSVTSFSCDGNSENFVKIEGGVGAINLRFQQYQ